MNHQSFNQNCAVLSILGFHRLKITLLSLFSAFLLLSVVIFPSRVIAQQPAQSDPANLPAPRDLQPMPEIPAPPRLQGFVDDNLEPQVTIRQNGDNKVEEFRVNGRLYAIRVTPKIGLPYLLVDQEGHGTMNKMDEIAGGLQPPQWVLIEF